MTTAAGIAAVTAILKDLLVNGLIDHDANTVLGDVQVTAQAPDRITVPEERSQLNLFLYLVMPNLGWRNAGLPSRNAEGELISAPPLALDLHYLLSAYGARDFHAEILLGYAMKLFHEVPVLSRQAIRNALSPTLPINGNGIPPDLQDLFQSGLADQIEQIKICPNYLNTEEMFKLWMAVQAPYRPTAAYQVSVVLIESDRQGKSAPPVRQAQVYAIPLRQPMIRQVRSQSDPNQPFRADQPILSTDRLALMGNALEGEITRVVISGQDVLENQLQVTDTQIILTLPTGLRAGIKSVQVVHLINLGTPPTPHRGVESNVAAFVLSPTLTAAPTVNITQGDGQAATVPRSGEMTLTIAPAVGKTQRVTLLLNEFILPPIDRTARAYQFEAPSRSLVAEPETTTITIPIVDVLPGIYVVRVRVDGAESPLGTNAPGYYATPQVTVL